MWDTREHTKAYFILIVNFALPTTNGIIINLLIELKLFIVFIFDFMRILMGVIDITIFI